MNQIPNDPSSAVNPAAFAGQARPDKGDTDVWASAVARTGTQNGCSVSQHAAGANMSVDVASGSMLVRSVPVAVTAISGLVVGTADPTNPRVDLVTVGVNGLPVITAGSPSAQPVWPAVPTLANAVAACLATVYVPAGVTSITAADITDKREHLEAVRNAPLRVLSHSLFR